MKKIVIFTLIFIPLLTWSQAARLSYANKRFDNFSYYRASEAYLDVLERTKDSLLVAPSLAISYDKMGAIEDALTWYKVLYRADSIDQKGLFRLAYLERMVESYKSSNLHLEEYQYKYEIEEDLSPFIMEDEEVKKLSKLNDNFDMRGGVAHQSTNSEIGASIIDNQLMITSSKRNRESVNDISDWTGNHYYNLYTARMDYETGEIINDLKNVKGEANQKFNAGLPSYDETNNIVYFTRNNFIKGKGTQTDENEVVRLKLYKGSLQKDKIVNVEELPFNNDEYSCTHPSISKDGKRLYFASDMPGGFGGIDIYYVEVKEDGTFGEPQNMGEKINTPYDEAFPFVKEEDGVLFFSSDGHKGLGGMDVFVAKMKEGGENEIYQIENLGAPINSSYDDFSFVTNDAQTFGYLASNRDGKDELYHFLQKKLISNTKIVEGLIADANENEELSDVVVYLIDENNEIVDSTLTNSKGEYTLEIEGVGGYKVRASKDGYMNQEKAFSTTENEYSYRADIQLLPKFGDYFLVGIIKDDVTKEPIEGVQISVTDLVNTARIESSTNTEGNFKQQLPNYQEGETMKLEVRLERYGYLTKRIEIEIELGVEKEISIHEFMDPDMTKIEEGSDIGQLIEMDPKPVYFDLNSSYLRREGFQGLNEIAQILKDNPNLDIELKAYADTRGSYTYNMWLSTRRANRCRDYLISQGIEARRISGKGYGYADPVVAQDVIDKAQSEVKQEELYQLNRRTEFIISKIHP